MKRMAEKYIKIRNANENNLKNLNVNIPLNAFTCITGPSGCGKSSLVYDTIYAESQRNFLESMSGNMYGHKLMDKPNVKEIENLRPALNVSQNYYNVNPRSTIGTVTDISYYLRTLFALFAAEVYGIQVDVNFFSANNPFSCCERCKGLGEEYIVSEDRLMPDYSKTLNSDGILYYKGSKNSQEHKLLEAVCEHFEINIDKKVSELTKQEIYQLLYRENAIEFILKFRTPKGRYKQKKIAHKGAIIELNELLKKIDVPSVFANISKFLVKIQCTSCKGTKLKSKVLEIVVEGKNIAEAEALTFDDLFLWLDKIVDNIDNMASKKQIEQIVFDMRRRLKCIVELNLEYLTLGRSIPSLSGGEIQRIRIARQLSCSLTGILYILDEPCKGLHYRNINSVIDASKTLVDKGNTVIAIEHNKQYISEAEKVIELGPSGGPEGGYIVSEYTGRHNYIYNIEFKHIEYIENNISFYGINFHNLKGVDASIPYGKITCLSGVSGSGKSSLTTVFAECCEKQKAVKCSKVSNLSKIKKVLMVNQQPIGKTPRSTVVSYLGIYDEIRDLFAECLEAKKMGLSSSDFSMNVPGGRCENCQGTGKKKIELTYLPDSYIVCPNCHGNRFHDDVISVKYKGYNINEILDSPISNIISLFVNNLSIFKVLKCMIDIGIGYISLGQMSMNLSGGEAQRIKLVKCLGVKSNGRNLYILDEPTSGLNDKDIKLLESILFKLSKSNETIVVIEHNIEFISHIADYMIDLGVVAGNKGGSTLIQGMPENVVKNARSSWKGFRDHF